MFHDVSAATESAYRHTATDDLAEAGEVGCDAKPALGAVGAKAKACHYLIKNQYAAVFGAQLAQSLHKPWFGQDAVHIAGNRLDDDAGEFIADFVECLLECVDVVVGQGHRVLRQDLGYTGRARHTKSERARAGLNQQRIRMPVVAAFKFDDLVAAGGPAGETNSAHGGFGTRVTHAQQIHRGHVAANNFCHFAFDLRGAAEA